MECNYAHLFSAVEKHLYCIGGLQIQEAQPTTGWYVSVCVCVYLPASGCASFYDTHF